MKDALILIAVILSGIVLILAADALNDGPLGMHGTANASSGGKL